MNRFDKEIAATFLLAAGLLTGLLALAAFALAAERAVDIPVTWLPYLVLPLALLLASLHTVDQEARRTEWLAPAMCGWGPLRRYRSLMFASGLLWLVAGALPHPDATPGTMPEAMPGAIQEAGENDRALPTQSSRHDLMREVLTLDVGGQNKALLGKSTLLAGKLEKDGTLRQSVLFAGSEAPRHLGMSRLSLYEGSTIRLSPSTQKEVITLSLREAKASRTLRRSFFRQRPVLAILPWTSASALHLLLLIFCLALPMQVARQTERFGLLQGHKLALVLGFAIPLATLLLALFLVGAGAEKLMPESLAQLLAILSILVALL